MVAGFQNLLPDSCIVVRDGHEKSIMAPDIVNGDIIIIKNGTRVPADARIIVSLKFVKLVSPRKFAIAIFAKKTFKFFFDASRETCFVNF